MEIKKVYKKYKNLKVPSLSEIRDNASEHSKTSLLIVILLVMLLLLALQYIPHYQVAQFNITNQKDLADAENGYRATLAQIFGGVAVLLGLYFAWGNLITAREGQITERFTRAVDQLGAFDQSGKLAIEIRLGGIYALERIANESEKDYWPIMEILTAYVRQNSSVELAESKNKVSLDVQAILDVIGRRKYKKEETIPLDLFHKYNHLNLSCTCLNGANFDGAHFEGVYFTMSHLKGANFLKSHLEGANFGYAYLDNAFFSGAHLEGTYFGDAHLEEAVFVSFIPPGDYSKGTQFLFTMFQRAHLEGAHFEGNHVSSAIFEEAHLEGAHFEGANFKKINVEFTSPKGKSAKVTGDISIFKGANLEGANFKEAKNLTVDQLSKAKTLYKAQLDEELEAELRAKGFGHLLDDEPKR